MKLDNIGFYTLTDERAKNTCVNSPLWRNEIIITSRCNFKCPYCRGTDINGKNGDMSFDELKNIINYFAEQKIQNIRLSGGEPTLHPQIKEIVQYIKEVCTDIKHIAISTNGYSDISLYEELIKIGVNDFSISLDACCSSVGDMMSGGVNGSWNKVIENIKTISKMTYTTVGMVFSEQNVEQMREVILFAHNLGVSDIRIISAAQWNNFEVFESLELPQDVLDAHPILSYRVKNFSNKRNVRGINKTDFRKCALVLDDMIIKGDYHYPCVIKMREGCDPIGYINDPNVRKNRYDYFQAHNCYCDDICKQNCLDVCVDYNNKYCRYEIEKSDIPKLDSTLFTWDRWEAGSVHDFGIEHFRYENVSQYKDKLLNGLIGYCFGEELPCRPKENHVALMYERKNGEKFWFHIFNSEFYELIKS